SIYRLGDEFAGACLDAASGARARIKALELVFSPGRWTSTDASTAGRPQSSDMKLKVNIAGTPLGEFTTNVWQEPFVYTNQFYYGIPKRRQAYAVPSDTRIVLIHLDT